MRRMLCVLLLLPLLGAAQQEKIRVGSIDFFGTAGLNVAAIRDALPVQPGDTIPESSFQQAGQQIKSVVARQTGGDVTDLSATCCGSGGGLLIYIGLPGKNSRTVEHLPAPTSSQCLPAAAVELYQQALAAVQDAVRAGDAGEDHERGYALSRNPALRRRQLAMRAYAVKHGPLAERALRNCGDAENRQAAAQLLGYARRSKAQVGALVRAAADADAGVRNNAVRALWVLASSSKKAARTIPEDSFVAMLNSGKWEDRNKAGLLLSVLAASRDARLLDHLRSEAFDSLAEMARWHDLGHAGPFRELLGALAGWDEHRIHQAVVSGEVEPLIAAAAQRQANR